MPADYPAFLSAKTFDAGWTAAGLDDEALFQLSPRSGRTRNSGT